jgi:hypothetical protein
MRNSILATSGDFLPVWKTETIDGKETTRRTSQQHKDGESPNEEWTAGETRAIRALANPAIGSLARAAEKAKVEVDTLKRWLRNPYFQNEVYKLTNSFLEQARAEVLGRVIQEAKSGSFQDRQLFFRLIGDLKDEKQINKKETSVHFFAEQSDAEVDDWIQSDIDSINEFKKRKNGDG